MDFRINQQNLTTFSSEGSLGQCENALKASHNGVLSLGACSSDGVVLCSLKTAPKLAIKQLLHKVVKICDNLGMTYSGLQPDFRIIHLRAVILAESYYEIYGCYPKINTFVASLSRMLQEYTQKSGMRPFGACILICGLSKECELYLIEPSGNFSCLSNAAIGQKRTQALKYVERRHEKLDDNVVNCVSAMKEFAGYTINEEDVDIGVFESSRKEFRVYSMEQVKEVFDSMAKH